MGCELWFVEVGVPDGDVRRGVFDDLWWLRYGSWSVVRVPKVLLCEVNFIEPGFGVI